MNRILAASAILLGLGGIAAAEGTVLYGGNYDASVLNQFGSPDVRGETVDVRVTSALHGIMDRTAETGTVSDFDIHSGR